VRVTTLHLPTVLAILILFPVAVKHRKWEPNSPAITLILRSCAKLVNKWVNRTEPILPDKANGCGTPQP